MDSDESGGVLAEESMLSIEQARYIKGKIVYQKDPEVPLGLGERFLSQKVI